MRTPPAVRDSFGWDVDTWSRALAFWLRESSVGIGSATALELGATGNNGGLSLWLATQGWEVVWSGLEAPEPAARRLHREYGVTGSISYQTIDVLENPYKASFDLIVAKSLLGALGMSGHDVHDAQRKAILGMFRALKPGGELWWVENAAGSPVHEFFRSRYGWGARGWRYLPLSEVPELFSVFAECSLTTFGVVAAFGRSETQRRALAAVDRCVLEPLCPPSWRYVVAGVARKRACT